MEMPSLVNLLQIVLIDLSMAGENAIVIGVAVASLPLAQRKFALMLGIAVATVLRIILAFFAVQLLSVTGLLAAGGLLLLWVVWKMLRDMHKQEPKDKDEAKKPAAKKMSEAVWQIVIADVSMSLDNVLGVAGVARGHMVELVLGLVLSVGLMAFASTKIAKLTEKHPKIAYVGAVVVLYTAVMMIYDGAPEVLALLQGPAA